MSEREIKITDKRMFTAEGELREEYRHLEDESAVAPEVERPESAAEPVDSAVASVESGADDGPPPRHEQAAAPRLEIPGTPSGLGAPTFLDLVGVLAEPVALYLGDIELPDGKTAENLEMARLHIDLLDLLRQKSAGNLTLEESTVLEDLLYRLRLRYVNKRG